MTTLAEDTPDSPPFSDILRDGTSQAHRDAEGSAFARALLQGRIDRAGYAAMVAQHHFVYDVLEKASDAMRDDPVAGPFVHDELRRGPALEADLRFLVGEQWRDVITPLPATTAYCDRLREVAFDWPGGFVAHHYTRYLGDLSGGQTVRKVVQRRMGLHEDGVRFYQFDEIDDPAAFKAHYRALLDHAPWDQSERSRIVDESTVAFRLNGALFAQLESFAS